MTEEEDGSSELKEALRDELRLLHDELGVPPRTIDMGKYGRFSPAVYSDVFGSWKDSLEAAGIEGEPRRPPDDAEPDLDSVREPSGGVSDESAADDEATEDGDTDTAKVTGTDVEDRADLDEHQRLLIRTAGVVDGVPTPDDLRRRGHSVNPILDEYGTWHDALSSVGLDVSERVRGYEGERTETARRQGRRRRSRADRRDRLLEEIRKYAGVRGRMPTEADVEDSDWMSPVEAYDEEFGAVWRGVDAVRQDGDDVSSDADSVPKDEDELVGELKRFYLRNGRLPTRDDLREDEDMSEFSCYIEVFGDLRAAAEASGLSGYAEEDSRRE